MSEVEVDLSNLRFGEYQAISELGRGATSTVYLAEKKFSRFDATPGADPDAPEEDFPSLDNRALEEKQKPARAAVKVVSFTDETSKLSRRFRKLFSTEAWAASQLDHPNITKVFDWKVEDDRAYLILEYLEGKTLDEYITMDKLLPVQQVVDIMHKIAVALDYAHRRGVVNRDVKPANVMLCANGGVKLMDFGLALNIKKNVNIDSTYINGLGSPSYMSPEQIKGYTLNHQTDLYSLGVMFYQLLSGRLPFRAKNTASLVYKIVNTEAVPVNQLNPELPEFTHQVISRAMEKDLYSRYRQGAQFAKDLSDAPYQRVKPGSTVNLDVRWKAVRALPMLGGLDDMDVWELLRASNWREFPPAKVIMHEGEAEKSFGIVIDGHVEIENGATAMTIASRGDFIGITEWLDSAADARRASTATTLDKVVYLEVNPAAFAYATEELSDEMHRLATDTVLKRMRSVIRLAKQLSPPAIHPAPEVAVAEIDDVVSASTRAGATGATAENPLGWGAFAKVDTLVPAPESTRRSSVVVQPMPAAAAAAIAQFALGAAAGQFASRPAPAFDLGPDGAGQNGFVPFLFDDDDRTIPTAPDVKGVDEMPAGAVLTTEMGANYITTTAYSTTDMAANFMTTTGLDDAGSEAPEPEAGVLAPDFDVHSGGAATAEMAPDFAGTTAFTYSDAPPDLPAIDAAPAGTFTLPRKSLKDVPPEDFDKTVEISGGFESQPVEDQVRLDDLFPPIKF